MSDYLEAAEVRMAAEGYLGDEPLTEFDGIRFGVDHPYSYREAKRLLKLGMAELRQRRDLRRIGMDPGGAGRPAITGRAGTSVWDLLPLGVSKGAANFTAHPHLTLSIQVLRTIVIVSLPNAVPAATRRRLTAMGPGDFSDLIEAVGRRVAKAVKPIRGAYPFVEVWQRHYTAQNAAPVVDAHLEFDIRTVRGSGKSGVRQQPQWVEATYGVLQKKRCNLHVGVGAVLPYGDARMHSRDVLDVIAGIWLGCEPWIRTVIGRKCRRGP